jgi:hypothetical protein
MWLPNLHVVLLSVTYCHAHLLLFSPNELINIISCNSLLHSVLPMLKLHEFLKKALLTPGIQ